MRFALAGIAVVLGLVGVRCTLIGGNESATSSTEERKLLSQIRTRTTPSSELTHTLPVGAGPILGVTWAPGASIVFPWKGMFSVRRDGRGLRRLVHFASQDTAWLPSGRELLVGRFVVSADGSRIRPIPGSWGFPAWSPRGDRIAYFTRNRVWVADANGRNRRAGAPTFTGGSWLSGPRWSPDGRHVVYSACLHPGPGIEDGGPEQCDVHSSRDPRVFVVAAGHRRPGRLIGRGECPDWSRRGYLAYIGPRGVVISTPDGSRRRLTITEPLQCTAWSPTGDLLAAETERGLVIADHRRIRLVARLPFPDTDLCNHFVGSRPAWSPDGKWIAVARQTGTCEQTSASRLYVVPVRDGRTHTVVRTLQAPTD